VGAVLNARGHRSGDDDTVRPLARGETPCSTPEGIEAATTLTTAQIENVIGGCSTPEGIEAATTREVTLFALDQALCSTPEGIEAATTQTFPDAL